MHIGLLLSPLELRSRDPWSIVTGDQNLATIFQGQQTHVSMRLDERNTTAFELFLQRSYFESYSRKNIRLFEVVDLASEGNK